MHTPPPPESGHPLICPFPPASPGGQDGAFSLTRTLRFHLYWANHRTLRKVPENSLKREEEEAAASQLLGCINCCPGFQQQRRRLSWGWGVDFTPSAASVRLQQLREIFHIVFTEPQKAGRSIRTSPEEREKPVLVNRDALW